MNCTQSNDYIMRYFDGELNDIETAQLKQHLKMCNSCNFEFESMQGILGFLENSNVIEPPPDFEFEIMSKIKTIEEVRKSKCDKALVFIYSFVTMSLAILSMVLLIGFKGISIYEIVSHIGEQFSSYSSTMFTLYATCEAVINFIAMVVMTFIQVMMIIVKTYYLIPVIFLAILITSKLSRYLIRGRV